MNEETNKKENIAAIIAGFNWRVLMTGSLREIDVVISARGILGWNERH